MKATITDTTATASVQASSCDIEAYGTWDGASLNLEIKTINGEWQTLATYTEDTFDVTLSAGSVRIYRFKASSVGASTSIKVGIAD